MVRLGYPEKTSGEGNLQYKGRVSYSPYKDIIVTLSYTGYMFTKLPMEQHVFSRYAGQASLLRINKHKT